MNRPTSFSQNNMFNQCARCWYYKYIKKIPTVQDLSYAHAGSVIHKVLEKHYNKEVKGLEETKQLFNNLWNKYNLDGAKWLRDSVNIITNLKKKTEYWAMIVNGINANVPITSTELKIMFPDVVGYIDMVNTTDDTIYDWKSSTRSIENEEEYTTQLLFYAYLYYRKFDRITTEIGVYYLKYSGSKQRLVINPTIEDIDKMELWHLGTRQAMEKVIQENKEPPMCKECFFFCPYKNICEEKNSKLKYELHTIGNQIQILGPMTDLLNKGLEKKFSYELKDAHWIKKKKPFANTIIRFWDVRTRKIALGFKQGVLRTLSDYADHKNMELVIEHKDHRTFNEEQIVMPVKFLNGIVLRDYQNEAVETFLKNKIGILQLATGAGKTEIAIECIRKLGVRTLFVVNKIELMNQTVERLEKSLGLQIGKLGHGIEDLQPITVATIQTLTKDKSKYASYLRRVRFVIFDECHSVAAQSYWKLSHQLIGSEYRLGLSATARRDDGNDMMIWATTGYILHDINSKKLIEDGWLVKPKITFIQNYMTSNELLNIESSLSNMEVNPEKDYAKAYKALISNNSIRNNIILDLVQKYNNKKILILVKLVSHGKELEKIIPNSKYLFGGSKKKERQQMFTDFKDEKLNILISTISIASEGLDIPSLDIVINAAANAGNIKTIQMLGRTLRTQKNKIEAHYLDFIDYTGFFKSASMKRRRALVKDKHNVQVATLDKI